VQNTKSDLSLGEGFGVKIYTNKLMYLSLFCEAFYSYFTATTISANIDKVDVVPILLGIGFGF
jgi:hypothetical protein